jgi:hypothetical protein
MCLLYATCPGIYAIIAAEVSQAFGHLHYQANFGLLYTQYVAYSVVIIVITKVGRIGCSIPSMWPTVWSSLSLLRWVG